ncbi:hypothetical protein APHAL10511_003584 [Amanita phalloides]|nr:hypothetical protein APHAL10511_003584 [Amanita phalloides]
MPELRDFLSSYRLKTLHFPLYSSDVATVIPLHSVLHDLPSEHLAHLKEVSIQAFDRAIYDIDLGAIFKAAPNLQYARFPQGRITLSRETLDDLAQCRLAPYLKWLTTGNIAKPFDFLEMIELRQKYAQEHVDSQMTHLGPSPLKYLWVCVDHDKYNSEEMRVNRTIIENLRIQFRLFAHR